MTVDDRVRCGWATSAPEYLAYHDDEWGRPLHGDRPLFERLSLEAFQSGLSWLTILRKRAAFRAAFADFDIAAVAGFGDDDVRRLLADAGIVRNRAKIEATIANARRTLDAVPEGLDSLLWSFAPSDHPQPATLADVPSTSPASTAMARATPPGIPVRRPDHRLCPHAGDRDRERSRRQLLAREPDGRTLAPDERGLLFGDESSHPDAVVLGRSGT
jgi:DNA-3-methyladenine glycosylase I